MQDETRSQFAIAGMKKNIAPDLPFRARPFASAFRRGFHRRTLLLGLHCEEAVEPALLLGVLHLGELLGSFPYTILTAAELRK